MYNNITNKSGSHPERWLLLFLFDKKRRISYNYARQAIKTNDLRGESMLKKKRLEKIASEYYAEILRYCKIKLNDDLQGAEDCTQDVFLLLVKKAAELDLKQNIRGWLYASADRIIKEYLKDKKKREELIAGDLESISNLPAEPEVHHPELDVLSAGEQDLLYNYYSMTASEREQLAREMNISLNTLYKRIHDIKEKIINVQNKDGHN